MTCKHEWYILATAASNRRAGATNWDYPLRMCRSCKRLEYYSKREWLQSYSDTIDGLVFRLRADKGRL